MKRRSGRAVALVNSATAVGLIAALAVIALVVHPPSPPGIAEFAPQASKPITRAPLTQAARHGTGPGACLPDQPGCAPAARATPTPSPLPSNGRVPRTGVPSAVQCYTWPDGSVTQTFDRQSPPCIASWHDPKGNGGATAAGVTGQIIRLVHTGYDYGLEDWWPTMIGWVNNHYQLYGRRLVIEHIPVANGNTSGSRSVKIRAQAASIASRRTFAALADGVGPWRELAEQLAQRGVLLVTGGVDPGVTSHLIDHLAPHLWSIEPAMDAVAQTAGDLACRTLARRAATRAGPELTDRTRAFVVAYTQPGDGEVRVDPRPLLDALRGCGARVRTAEFAADESTDASARNQPLIAELRAGGWTTNLWLDTSSALEVTMRTFSSSGYQPEWVSVGFAGDAFGPKGMETAMPDQRAHLFGIWPGNKLQSVSDTPAWRAYRESGGTSGLQASALPLYRELTLIAAGVQMAGPHLTTASFRAGLEATTFPNPGTGAAPAYQADVGFADGDFTFDDDYALVWWTDTARTSYSTGAGTWCFFQAGRRYRTGTWPRGGDLFDPADCR